MPLNLFKVLVIPYMPGIVTTVQEKALHDFVAGGGKIFAATSGGAVRNWDMQSAKKDKEKLLKLYKEIGVEIIAPAITSAIEKGGDIEGFISKINEASGGPVVTLTNAPYVLANVTKAEHESDTLYVHLINYDLGNTAKNITLKLNFAEEMVADSQAVVCSTGTFNPDAPKDQENIASANISGKTCEIKIKELKRYQVLKVSLMD
jgi:hypothetical protein